jgi:large subunit ribosomal protein L23
MAFFSRKKDSKEKGVTMAVKTPGDKVLVAPKNISAILLRPRVTEKAVGQGEKNVYTFVIKKEATKGDVKEAVKKLFGVTPVGVNIVNKQPKQYRSRSKGRTITQKGLKKAYVYLKDGDSINLV